MEERFERKPPEDSIKRIHEFAADLALGVVLGLWSTRLHEAFLNSPKGGTRWEDDERSDRALSNEELRKVIIGKWDGSPPLGSTLFSFGYVTSTERSHSYLLTQKAFDSLSKPPEIPLVFISYKRDQSSPLALLIEARLKIAGNPAVFIDKNLIAGEAWHGKLKESISKCEYFVCLIGPGTLSSEWVQKEIRWAASYGCKIISIWHDCRVSDNWSNVPDDCVELLTELQVIEVGYTGSNTHSALDYEFAINRLLNNMGYSTY